MRSAMLARQKTDKSIDVQPICRICLSEEEENNPLISPCSCTGSMKHIHLTCLKEWLEGKKHMKETAVVNSYIWKNLECEICKTAYSDVTTLKSGKYVNLLNYRVHDLSTTYMIIESVTNTTSKTIHVINFNERRKIKVGRGQQAEVRITDISVSRFHTMIKVNKKGEVIIEDNQSKFGTLVQIDRPTAIKAYTPTYVQVGRAVIVLFTINRFSCIQKLFCAMAKKRREENCLHYDEAAKFYPEEFKKVFEEYSILANNRSKNSSLAIRPESNFQDYDRHAEMQSEPHSHIEPHNNQRAIMDNVYSPRIPSPRQHVGSVYRGIEENQMSLAIEFTTNQGRLESDGGNSRSVVINGLVRQMQGHQTTSRTEALRISNSQAGLLAENTDSRSQSNVLDFPYSNNFQQPNRLIVLEEQKEEEEQEDEELNSSRQPRLNQENPPKPTGSFFESNMLDLGLNSDRIPVIQIGSRTGEDDEEHKQLSRNQEQTNSFIGSIQIIEEESKVAVQELTKEQIEMEMTSLYHGRKKLHDSVHSRGKSQSLHMRMGSEVAIPGVIEERKEEESPQQNSKQQKSEGTGLHTSQTHLDYTATQTNITTLMPQDNEDAKPLPQ